MLNVNLAHSVGSSTGSYKTGGGGVELCAQHNIYDYVRCAALEDLREAGRRRGEAADSDDVFQGDRMIGRSRSTQGDSGW
jgi:hypothetical protein